MKLHYLGTAAAEGWPALFCNCENCRRARLAKGKNYRSRPQVLIDGKLMMDFGPDTFYHMMKYDLDFTDVRQVLLTHSHTDHFYSTELILRAMPYAFDRDKNKMILYGNEKCHWMFLRTLQVEDDSENMRDCVGFQQIEAFQTIQAGDYQVTSLQAIHDPKEECLIYLIRDQEGKTFLYANDTGYFPESTWQALEGCKLDGISLDCTLGKNPTMEAGHMGLYANRKVVERLRSMGCIGDNTKIVLTHFSHNGGLLHEELEEETKKDGFIIAYDGMILYI